MNILIEALRSCVPANDYMQSRAEVLLNLFHKHFFNGLD